MTTIMYVSAILAVVIILTIIGVLSRYRRCKPNQVLVVYGKTGGEKKSAKLYHGGAAFVGPRLHLGLIEEAKAAFIDFMPAGIVIFSALLINIFLIWILDKI